jgi:hypothetical protein
LHWLTGMTRAKHILTGLGLLALASCDPGYEPGGATPVGAPEVQRAWTALAPLAVELEDADFQVGLGAYDAAAGYAWKAFGDGQAIEIVQGPQGGIHAETALELDLGAGAGGAAFVDIYATLTIEGDPVAALDVEHFQVTPIGGGIFRTPVLPVYFVEDVAAPYAEQAAVLRVEVGLDGSHGAADCAVWLVDEE